MVFLMNLAGGMIASFISIAVFLVTSYAFFKLACVRMLPNAWLCFIPFFSLYMNGMIMDSLKYNHYKINQYISDIPLAYALPALALAQNFLAVSFITSIISLILALAEILLYYFVFSLYAEPKSKILFTVLSIIPFVGPLLILYVLRDR